MQIQNNAGLAVCLTTNRQRKLAGERGSIISENVPATEAALGAKWPSPPYSSARNAASGRLDAFDLPIRGPGNDAARESPGGVTVDRLVA